MHFLKRIVLPGLLALAAYYTVFGGEYSMLEVRRARHDIEAARAELVTVDVRIDSLRARVDSLENDPGTLERVARERFGMIREGETLYRFATPDEEGPPRRAGP